MPPNTVNIVCAKASAKVPCVPAYRYVEREYVGLPSLASWDVNVWLCSFCGARVKVVA